jgi:hypothetical protein
MPATLKLLLYTTAAFAILIGSTLYQAQSAAQKPVAEREQTAAQRWAAASMMELAQKAEQQAGVVRTADYEECARNIRADYSDDPVEADGWVRTLCH